MKEQGYTIFEIIWLLAFLGGLAFVVVLFICMLRYLGWA